VLRDVQGETAPVRLVTAADGVEALAVLDAAPPDLIVLDLRMPGLDGFAFCRRVRAEPRFRSIPLIVLTALGPSDEVRRRALDAGCDAFLAKPFDLDDLADVIAHWLRVSAANRPT
jgi:CheY-like chemotaxis protein